MSKELELLKEAVKILEEKEKTEVDDKVKLSTLQPGETFKIGEHDFIVLGQKLKEMETIAISKELMAEDVKFDENTRDYKVSNLRRVIETEIQPVIESGVGADNIIEHEVQLTSVDMQNEFGLCKCKVRPLTFDEAREFNEYITNKELNDWWWTCTPWSTAAREWPYSLAVVSPSGDIFNDVYYDYDGVRPFCILKSNIFVSKGEQ